MNEIARAFEWLYDTLTEDSTLATLVGARVYRGVAPQGEARPCVVYNAAAGHDVMTVGTARVITHVVVTVKAVGRNTDYAALKSVADALDAALHGARGSASGALVLSCYREMPLDYIEHTQTETYAHLGGQYRLLVQAWEEDEEE